MPRNLHGPAADQVYEFLCAVSRRVTEPLCDCGRVGDDVDPALRDRAQRLVALCEGTGGGELLPFLE